MKKFAVLLFSILFTATLFCGCDKEESQTVNYEDLDYGTTMRQIIDGNIDMYFDSRFFTDEEMNAVSDYFYAIQTEDVDLFLKTQPEHYINYLMEESGMEASDFLEDYSSDVIENLGEGFEYTYIEATNCETDEIETGIDEIKELLNGIYEDQNNDKTFEETIKSAKYVTLELTAKSQNDDNTYVFPDKTLYVFTCEDGIYII